jgi:hypothetical protein
VVALLSGGLAGLIPFLAQDLRVSLQDIRLKGDQKSGDEPNFKWCEPLSDKL